MLSENHDASRAAGAPESASGGFNRVQSGIILGSGPSRHRGADGPHVLAPERLPDRRLDRVAPERPERLPVGRDVLAPEARLLEQAQPDVDVSGDPPDWQRVEAARAGA